MRMERSFAPDSQTAAQATRDARDHTFGQAPDDVAGG